MLLTPQPADSGSAAGLLANSFSKVSACGRRVGGYVGTSAANPPYI